MWAELATEALMHYTTQVFWEEKHLSARGVLSFEGWLGATSSLQYFPQLDAFQKVS